MTCQDALRVLAGTGTELKQAEHQIEQTQPNSSNISNNISPLPHPKIASWTLDRHKPKLWQHYSDSLSAHCVEATLPLEQKGRQMFGLVDQL